MNKAIITGADGFLGRHLVDRLLAEGVEVWAIVYPESPMKDVYLGRPFVTTVCTDYSQLALHTSSFPKGIDAFYHLAWQGVNAESRDDFEMQSQNIGLTFNCLKFAHDIGVNKFIIPGSTSEYLEYGKPINEKALPTPQNAYGAVKVALRYLSKAYADQISVGLIYTVITGIYASDRKDNNVIFYTIDKLLRGEKPSLTKLEQKWDYVYIDDVVEALYLIGDKGRPGKFYAIGSGDNKPLYEYIEQIREYIKPSASLGIGEIPYKNEILPSSCIDLSALQDDTGFVPKVGFAEGIRRVINEYRKEMFSETN